MAVLNRLDFGGGSSLVSYRQSYTQKESIRY